MMTSPSDAATNPPAGSSLMPTSSAASTAALKLPASLLEMLRGAAPALEARLPDIHKPLVRAVAADPCRLSVPVLLQLLRVCQAASVFPRQFVSVVDEWLNLDPARAEEKTVVRLATVLESALVHLVAAPAPSSAGVIPTGLQRDSALSEMLLQFWSNAAAVSPSWQNWRLEQHGSCMHHVIVCRPAAAGCDSCSSNNELGGGISGPAPPRLVCLVAARAGFGWSAAPLAEDAAISAAQLSAVFTARERNEDNLGEYIGSQQQGIPVVGKLRSRLAGLMAMKAAIRAAFSSSAELPLGEGADWLEIEFARVAEASSTQGGPRFFRRLARIGPKIVDIPSDALLSFADDGGLGVAMAVLPDVSAGGCSAAPALQLVSIGIDMMELPGPLSSEPATVPAQHCVAEALYKATYRGGQQSHFLPNVYAHVSMDRALGPSAAMFAVSGASAEAMARLGAADARGWWSQSTLERSGGRMHQLCCVLLSSRVASQKPALAQMIESGEVHAVYVLPGQASEFVPMLRYLCETSPAGRGVILRQLARMQAVHGIDTSFVMGGAASGRSPDDIIRADVSQPLIGLAQAAINAHVRSMGYDLSKFVILGHSQGQMLGLHAAGALDEDDILDFLSRNGRMMQTVDCWWDPEAGDPLTLTAIASAPTDRQSELVEAYTGKVSMASVLGLSVAAVETMLEAVRREDLQDMGTESVDIGLINVEPSCQYEGTLAPEGWVGNTEVTPVVVVSGTTGAIKAVFRRMRQMQQSLPTHASAKIRLLPITVAFHSSVVQEALWRSWRHMEGKSLRPMSMPAILNSDGRDMRLLASTPPVTHRWRRSCSIGCADREAGRGHDAEELRDEGGEQEETATVDAMLTAVAEEQFVKRVDWPRAVWSALRSIGDTWLEKPIVVINGGPGLAIGKFVESITTDGLGRCLVKMLHFDSAEGRSLLAERDPAAIRRWLATSLHPQEIVGAHARPLARQVFSGAPFFHGEYSGPVSYIAGVRLSDDRLRTEFMRRVERALHLTDDSSPPHFHSEFLEELGYDSSMPIAVAAMTGNSRVEMVASLASRRYLCFLATTTLGADLDGLYAELRAIHSRTQQLLREKGVASWERGRPFGANVIHGDAAGFWKAQVARVLQARVQDGVPVNIMSIAFSMVTPADWKESYEPLLRAGIALMPLCENERRWQHFLETIYPEVDPSLRHLLAFAPEGAEGGGHNIDRANPSIRYSYALCQLLLQAEPESLKFPWFMTGGQSTPQAIADAMLVMAMQPRRGGVQVGGLMQIALESAPPPQVKRFIAEAALAGPSSFVQSRSEFDRSINLVRNAFADDLVCIGDLLQGIEPLRKDRAADGNVAGGTAVPSDVADKIAGIFLHETPSQRALLHRLWLRDQANRSTSSASRAALLKDGWPQWLAGDREALARSLATKTPREIVSLFRSYRTWALMESDVDPQRAYVLGGVSIRAALRSLQEEGVDGRKYLLAPAHEILEDLRDRTIAWMMEMYRRAIEVERSSQPERVAHGDEVPWTVIDEGCTVVHEGADTVVTLSKNVDGAQWMSLLARKFWRWQRGVPGLMTALVAKTMQVAKTSAEVDNPLLETLRPSRGDVFRFKSAVGDRYQLEKVTVATGAIAVAAGRTTGSSSSSSIVSVWYDREDSVVVEEWQLDGGVAVQWLHPCSQSRYGCLRVQTDPGHRRTLDALREAYLRRWNCLEGPPEIMTVELDDVLHWHRTTFATSKHFVNVQRHSAGSALGPAVHPMYALRLAWRSLVHCALTSPYEIDFSRVVHLGQFFQLSGASLQVGDHVTASSSVFRVEDSASGREIQVLTVVERQGKEGRAAEVARLLTKFLSRGFAPLSQAQKERRILVNRHRSELGSVEEECDPAAPAGDGEGRPVQSVRGSDEAAAKAGPAVFSRSFSISRAQMSTYWLDLQWLHTDDRFARRFGFPQGVIVQGWLLLLYAAHVFVEAHAGVDALQHRFVGFGERTGIVSPVLPDEKLVLEVGFSCLLRNGIEVFSFTLTGTADGRKKARGSFLLRSLPHCAMFTGNASQRLGMGASLCEESPAARATLERALRLVDQRLVRLVCDPPLPGQADAGGSAADEELLNSVESSSCAVVATSVAYFDHAIAECGLPMPGVVVGHSLGQYSAAVVAGCLSLEEAMFVVRERGLLLKKYCAGRMASVVAKSLIDVASLQVTLAEIACSSSSSAGPRTGPNAGPVAAELLEIANINCLSPDYSQVVISGDASAVSRAAATLAANGLMVKLLAGSVAFHSSRVRVIDVAMQKLLTSQVSLCDPRIPMLSIVRPTHADGSPRLLRGKDEVLDELVSLNAASVQWDGAIKVLRKHGHFSFVEYGSSSVLTNLVSRVVGSRTPSGLSSLPPRNAVVKHASAAAGMGDVVGCVVTTSLQPQEAATARAETRMPALAGGAVGAPGEQAFAVSATAAALPGAVAPFSAGAALKASATSGGSVALAPLKWCAVDLALSTCRIDASGAVSASPLMPSIQGIETPADLLWVAMVSAVADTNDNVKPSDIVLGKKLASLNLSSLEISGLVTQVRHRLNISTPPADADTKDLEGGTVDGVILLMNRLWNHGFAPAPAIAKGSSHAWASMDLPYKAILSKEKISGRTFYDLAKEGKIPADPQSPAMASLLDFAQALVGQTASDENMEYLLKQIEDWRPSADFKREAENLRKVRLALFQQLAPVLRARRSALALEGAGGDATSVADTTAAGATGLISSDALPALVREAVHKEVERMSLLAADGAPFATAKACRGLDDRPVVLDLNAGAVSRDALAADALQSKRILDRLRMEISDRFLSSMVHDWPARVHTPWSDVEMNACVANVLRLVDDVTSGSCRPASDEYRFRVMHLAWQMDAVRRAWITSLLSSHLLPEAGCRICVDLLSHEKEGVTGIPFWWQSVHTVRDPSTGRLKCVPRPLSAPGVLSRWLAEDLVDRETVLDVQRLLSGGVDLRGKRVLVFGGLGTIGKPVICALLCVGAEVWLTSRSSFGQVEDAVRGIRDEWAISGASVHVSTSFVPNYTNIESLVACHQKHGWKPDIVINAMACEDYGAVHQRLDFLSVMHTIVDAFRYAVGLYAHWFREDAAADQKVLTVFNFASPNDNFALGGSGSYSIAKASMPPGQWAHRRGSESLFYPPDTRPTAENGADEGKEATAGVRRPVLREVSLITGAVVPRPTEDDSAASSAAGIMSAFQKYADALEEVSATRFSAPLWVFDGMDMAAVVVALLCPSHGDADLIGRRADGGFLRLDRTIPGGVQAAVQTAAASAASATPDSASDDRDASSIDPAGSSPLPPTSHVRKNLFAEGQLRSLLDYGLWVDEINGNECPLPAIQDEDAVIVGVGMVSTWGESALSSWMNMMDLQKSHIAPPSALGSENGAEWPALLGVCQVARAIGLPIEDGMSGQEVMARFGKQIKAALGPRLLERNGQRADAYCRYEDYVDDDEILLGAAGAAALQSGPLRETIDRLVRTGYHIFERRPSGNSSSSATDSSKEAPILVAKKAGASLSRIVVDMIGPHVVADIPPLDWQRLGANLSIVDHDARNVLMGQMGLTEACRQMGMLPAEVTERHGAQNVCVLFSNGLGPLETLRRQQQECLRGGDVGQLGVVLSIPSASAGRTASDLFGATGPATDDPQACATAKKTVWTAVQQLKAGFKHADDLERRQQQQQQKDLRLQREAERARRCAQQRVLCIACADDGATPECQNSFDRVGAMLRNQEAADKEFPPERQCRPHDRAKVPKFQAGVGAGAMMMVTGWSVKKYGYKPLAIVRAAQCGTDGPTQEPDGKNRAWTGVGRFGQRKVFADGLREARLTAGVCLEDMYMMSSHSTGTLGDAIQSESFVIGAFLEAIDWYLGRALFLMDASGDRETSRNRSDDGDDEEDMCLCRWLRSRIADGKTHLTELCDLLEKEDNLLERSTLLAHRLGFSTADAALWTAEIGGLDRAVFKALHLDAVLVFESHPKYNLRHCLGGTLTEDVLLLMAGTMRRTLPHPGLNNLESATGLSPFSTTLAKSTDVSLAQPPRLSFADDVAKVATAGDWKHIRYCVGGNSFGFNGLDGFLIYELPQVLRFGSASEAAQWLSKALQLEARSVALHRALHADLIRAIAYVQPADRRELIDESLYPDLRRAMEDVEDTVQRILVDRQLPAGRLPWYR